MRTEWKLFHEINSKTKYLFNFDKIRNKELSTKIFFSLFTLFKNSWFQISVISFSRFECDSIFKGQF